MAISTKVSGQWKNVREVFVKVSGQWKKCQNVYTRVSGVWKPLMTHTETKTLHNYSNDTTRSTVVRNVAIGTTMTVVYTIVNNEYDGSDWASVYVSGANKSGGDWDWRGGNSGTRTLTCIATARDVTFSTNGHGMTSGYGDVTYESDS